jgi:hypothetical protein
MTHFNHYHQQSLHYLSHLVNELCFVFKFFRAAWPLAFLGALWQPSASQAAAVA